MQTKPGDWASRADLKAENLQRCPRMTGWHGTVIQTLRAWPGTTEFVRHYPLSI